MKKRQYQIVEPGNENLMIAEIMAWDEIEAMDQISKDYHMISVSNHPNKPSIIEVVHLV